MENSLAESDIKITISRIAKKQIYRANVLADYAESYFKVNIFIPYVDSLILSLKERFLEENEVPYFVFQLLPEYMSNFDENRCRSLTEKISKKCISFLDNFAAESMIWYDNRSNIQKSKNVLDILKEAEIFYPSVFSAICIGLSFPAITCTAERSFSILRRVKTWIRSNMTNERLDALCMMNIHKSKIIDLINNNKYYEEIVDRFGRDMRRLQFLFEN